MECQEAQESILESLINPLTTERGAALESHIGTCDTCRKFAEIQRSLDARLTAAVPAPRLISSFRASLRERICHDPVSAWPDFLPDLAHLIGCAFAILLSLSVLPQYSGTVILAGVTFTAVTYFLQAALRSSLDVLEADA
jgi:hypothetical protein